MFNAQEYLESTEPPVFIDQLGRKHVGRVLSLDEWAPLQAEMKGISDVGVTWPEMQRLLLKLTRRIFPKPWWRVWDRSVASWIRRLPPVGQMRAVWSFIESQAKAIGMDLPPAPGIQRWLRPSATSAVASSPMAG